MFERGGCLPVSRRRQWPRHLRPGRLYGTVQSGDWTRIYWLQDDNRLIGLLRQGHQPPAVREIFKIHADHLGLRVRHEIGQVIAFVQIQLVCRC